jgi:hypothetical protein
MKAQAKKSKRATRLTEMIGSWKPAKPQTSQQVKARPNTQPIDPVKPRKDHKLLRFRQFIGKHSLREAAATEADIAGASLIVIDGSRTGRGAKTSCQRIWKGLHRYEQ